jgi:hypothetical protein
MAHDSEAVCLCVAEHRPSVLEYERHHVTPLYLGGLTSGEVVWLCPTTHANCHELLRLMLRLGRALTHYELQAIEDRPVSRYAATLAREGFRRWQATQP